MMYFLKIFPLLPIIPALAVFGFGMFLLHMRKKGSSPFLKWGGYVTSVGSALIIVVLLVFAIMGMTCKGRYGHPMGHMGMGMGPMGKGCPMMEMMKEGGMKGRMYEMREYNDEDSPRQAPERK